MRKTVLISIVIVTAVIAVGQHGKSQIGGGKTSSKPKTQKPKMNPRPSPTIDPEPYLTPKSEPIETPCGVHYKNFDDFVADAGKGWQFIAKTGDNHFWYDANTEHCEADGILKVWIKIMHIDYKIPGRYALNLYELRCKAKQFRIRSINEYERDGTTISTIRGEAAWDDTVPEFI